MAHYFDEFPDTPNNRKMIEIKIRNVSLKILTDNNVFSKRGLDFGTRLLLENLDLSKLKGDILDFGCGYGPIGIYLSKEANVSVDMIDINSRSLELANENSELNKVKTNVFYSNQYSDIKKKYDFIITNPPIRVGKKILYEILFDAKKYLNHHGELWLVINKDQGAKSLIRDLEKEYEISIKAKDKGFYVICAYNH